MTFLMLYIFMWFHVSSSQTHTSVLPSPGYPERVHEKCIDKSSASEIHLNCHKNSLIAIHEAFMTTSPRLRCPFKDMTTSGSLTLTNEELEVINSYPRIDVPCTEDLRFSINRRCSGRGNCTFSLPKDHGFTCRGNDGSVVIRFSCMPPNKFHPFCNVNLKDKYGYVSTPGYPEYYPPLDRCVLTIEGDVGQIIQIDILDLSIKEPKKNKFEDNKSYHTFKQKHTYSCTDKLIILEGHNKIDVMCGEDNMNLRQLRTNDNRVTIEFKSEYFSPSRGVLFRYSLQNCPSIPAPRNGHLERNGSVAHYTCCDGYVFEDTKLSDRVLYCEYGVQWNSTLSQCIPKEEVQPIELDAIIGTSSASVHESSADKSEDGSYISDILIPVIIMIALLLGNAVIVWILLRLKRKNKRRQNATDSEIPLNANRPTNV